LTLRRRKCKWIRPSHVFKVRIKTARLVSGTGIIQEWELVLWGQIIRRRFSNSYRFWRKLRRRYNWRKYWSKNWIKRASPTKIGPPLVNKKYFKQPSWMTFSRSSTTTKSWNQLTKPWANERSTIGTRQSWDCLRHWSPWPLETTLTIHWSHPLAKGRSWRPSKLNLIRIRMLLREKQRMLLSSCRAWMRLLVWGMQEGLVWDDDIKDH
jgi:hypothetical protein